MRQLLWKALCASVLSVGLLASPAHAASSGTFVFDFAGDPGDNADGPQYDITLTGPTDDGAGCDEFVMIMIDPTGIVVDIDPGCIVGTTGSDDGDHGTVFPPAASPITYALFDLTAADAATLSGLSQSDPAYLAYVVANARLLAERTLAVDGLPTQPAFSFLPKFSAPVPTLGEFGLAALALLMLAMFAWQHRTWHGRR